MNPPRTLVIGLDGATFDLIDPLVGAGYLPTLRRLMEQGARGPLLSWPAPNSAAGWSSMVTGYNPGEHGIYNFGQSWKTLPQPGHKWQPVTAADRKKDPVWRVLSAAGQRVGVINVPITYPADRVNGFMLAGMDAPGVKSRGFAHPAGLYDELRQQGINYAIETISLYALSRKDPHRLPRQVRDMVAARAQAVLHLMQTRAWDFLMLVLVAPDRVQHCYWPNLEAPVEDDIWTPIRSLYEQIDAFLADALAFAGKKATVLIVSDHGFARGRAALFCLNRLFARLGLLRYHSGAREERVGLLGSMLSRGRRYLPHRLQHSLAKMLPGLHLRAASAIQISGIDWAQTQVYAIPLEGLVLLNVQGQGADGTTPAADYDSLRERVAGILSDLVDPVSGRRVIKKVSRGEDVYHGPYVEGAPDLEIDWDYSALDDGLSYPVGSETVTVAVRRKRGAMRGARGIHHPQGIFIAHGPNIQQGVAVTGARLYDIAPTILYLQNQPVPEGMDGRVLTEMFGEAYVRDNPPLVGPPTDTGPQSERVVLGPDEERLIEERLRGLGYL